MAIDNETMQVIERCVARAVANATSLKGAADEISKGVTQYVGARYVPLFAEPLEWDTTKAYEPLTIVLYQGNSYTSRQYVPVGVELTNDAFWAETGNYNAQIEQYRQEVKAFDSRITANKQAIETETINRAEAVSAEKSRAEKAEKKSVICFKTVNDLKTDANLSAGMTVRTSGFYSENDGGGGIYSIVDDAESNGMDIISCSNALNAKLIVDKEVTIESLGAKQGTDVTSILEYALQNYSNVGVLKKNYNLSRQINIGQSHLKGYAYKHVGTQAVDIIFNWIGGRENAAFAMMHTDAPNKLFDKWPIYGCSIENISVNGNDNLAIGFLVTGQETSYANEISAVNCNIGIVLTRLWNCVIGNIHSFYCKLGFSTVPALELDSSYNPVSIDYVKDTTVNNTVIQNITSQHNGCGVYLSSGLAPTFNCIDIENCKQENGYGLSINGMFGFFPNVHIEHNNSVPVTNVDLLYNAAYENRICSFGALQCQSINSKFTINVDTLKPFEGPTSPISILNQPVLASNYAISRDVTLDKAHLVLPKVCLGSGVSGNKYPVTGRALKVLMINPLSTDSEAKSSITFTGIHGAADKTIELPIVKKNDCKLQSVYLNYADGYPDNTTFTLTGTTTLNFIIFEGEYFA